MGGEILFVKMSSLGDVIHNFAAVTDAARARPGLRVDWVVEEAYVPLVTLHPAVRHAIPINLRRLTRNLSSRHAWSEFAETRKALRAQAYRQIIDTQGLIKSAAIARIARGPRWGMDRATAREPLAALAYQHSINIPRGQHAVARNRQLAAAALGYEVRGAPDYGLSRPPTPPVFAPPNPYAVLLHATSRSNKEWLIDNWVQLGQSLAASGVAIVLPWGNAQEKARSEAIAEQVGTTAHVPPAMALPDAAALLGHACLVVGVDTGLAHLAVALAVPTFGIYVATDPGLTGLLGENAVNLGGKGAPPTVADVTRRVFAAVAGVGDRVVTPRVQGVKPPPGSANTRQNEA